MMRSYRELITLPTFKERFEYCDLFGKVGDETFGHDRWLNQVLYNSDEWKEFRREVIIRDQGCEFALPGFDILKYGTIHHLNPVSKADIINRRPCVFDLDNVVLVGSDTHRFIHYGRGRPPQKEPVIRRPNDTCPWR